VKSGALSPVLNFSDFAISMFTSLASRMLECEVFYNTK
jgi:hypothetical protein